MNHDIDDPNWGPTLNQRLVMAGSVGIALLIIVLGHWIFWG